MTEDSDLAVRAVPALAAWPAPSLRMTYEEFLDWADEDTRAEWVNGKLVFKKQASKLHQEVGAFLIPLLGLFAEAHQLGEVFYESFPMKPGADLPGRLPDILFVAQENLERVKAQGLEGPADLAVGTISPESRARDHGAKFYEYEQGGVRDYWLIDPLRKQAEFYQLGDDGIYRLTPPDEAGVYHSAVLPGLWLKVIWLWQQPLPTSLSVLKEWKLI